MPLIPVIYTIQVLVPLRWVTPHLIYPLEERFVLNPVYILCTSSLNAALTSPIYASGSCILKSFRGLRGKTPCRERFSNRALPLLCSRSSSRRLYSAIRLMSCLISSGCLFVNDARSSESSGSPILKVLAVIFSLPPPISL